MLRIGILVMVCGLMASALALAQETRLEQIEQRKAAKAAMVRPEPREKGDKIITKLERMFTPQPPSWRPTFGGFRAGAGFAAGVQYAAPVGRSLWTTKAAWSVKNFKQLETTLALPPISGDRFQVNAFAKWNDAPDLPYYGLGNDAARNETSYGLRWVDAGLAVEARAGRIVRYGVGAGYFGVHSSDGRGPDPDIGRSFSEAEAPGLGATPTWVHTRAYAAIDTRDSPGYSRRGGLYQVTLHNYDDREDRYSFHRTQIEVRQFIPVLHENWVVALGALANMTDPVDGQTVPYFLLPTMGGRDTLPGFDQYRFADRNSLLLRGELRWAAAPVADVAVFVDQGKVAAEASQLDLHNLHRSVGGGVRIHGPASTVLRLEVARGVEGWRLNIAQGLTF